MSVVMLALSSATFGALAILVCWRLSLRQPVVVQVALLAASFVLMLVWAAKL